MSSSCIWVIAPTIVWTLSASFLAINGLSYVRLISYISTMKDYTTIIFDLDGTLVHSAPDLQFAVNAALAENGRRPLDLDVVTSFIGDGVEKLVERSLSATGGVTDELLSRALVRFHQVYEGNLTSLTRPYPGVVDCLNRLRSQGVTMGICTNKPTGPARAICDQLAISQYFDAIMGSEPGTFKKPDPTPLLACVSALGGHLGTAIFVGDSDVDVQTARSAGIALRFFSGGYHKVMPTDVLAEHCFDDWTTVAMAD